MTLFQERIKAAFDAENSRRLIAGEPRLTKTALWKAAKVSSGAATHWFDGSNAADLDTCYLLAPLLKCDARWLFDGSISKEARSTVNTEALGKNLFPLTCPKCHQVSVHSFVELELYDVITCLNGHAVKVSDQYSLTLLNAILQTLGGGAFTLRKLKKGD